MVDLVLQRRIQLIFFGFGKFLTSLGVSPPALEPEAAAAFAASCAFFFIFFCSCTLKCSTVRSTMKLIWCGYGRMLLCLFTCCHIWRLMSPTCKSLIMKSL